MNPRPCPHHSNLEHANSISGRWHNLPDVLEIAICCLCSVVTWNYTVQNELPQGQSGIPGQYHGDPDDIDASIFRPSPGLMLFSCLVFGCCVSSFTHRRQEQDPFQFVVYLIILGCAAIIGYTVRAHLHLILLGYLPWATCVAMAISISAHSAYRCLRPDPATTSQRDEEKERLLG
ncbi:hypothetical protein VTI28DRAFT_9535 [Corynascus sepedonium]